MFDFEKYPYKIQGENMKSIIKKCSDTVNN